MNSNGADSRDSPVDRQDDEEEWLVGGKYRLHKKVGSGSFGVIFSGNCIIDNKPIAIKIESGTRKRPMLRGEARIYKMLEGGVGVPKCYYHGTENKMYVMVTDLLGPNLEELLHYCDQHRFSIKTTIMLGLQMISRLEYMHSKQIIHRDIKPDNFLMGCQEKEQGLCHLIDFGLSKKYLQPDGTHIEHVTDKKKITGTARYVSVNTHVGHEQARRDDLESLAYLLLYFLRGSLPWQNMRAQTKEERNEKIKEKKMSTSIEALCRGFPVEFAQFLAYTRALSFEQMPDYNYLKGLLHKVFIREEYVDDHMYDWNEKHRNQVAKGREDATLPGHLSGYMNSAAAVPPPAVLVYASPILKLDKFPELLAQCLDIQEAGLMCMHAPASRTFQRLPYRYAVAFSSLNERGGRRKICSFNDRHVNQILQRFQDAPIRQLCLARVRDLRVFQPNLIPSYLYDLQTLTLSWTQIQDITFIGKYCLKLEMVNLGHTLVTDLSPLSSLKRLHTLQFHHTEVSSVLPLSGCSNLRHVTMRSTAVTDLAGLGSLTFLRKLNCRSSPVCNIDALSQCLQLKLLNLNKTQVVDVSPLACCPSLRKLYLQRTAVADVAMLSRCLQLKTCDLRETRVRDIEALSRSCPKLRVSRPGSSSLHSASGQRRSSSAAVNEHQHHHHHHRPSSSHSHSHSHSHHSHSHSHSHNNPSHVASSRDYARSGTPNYGPASTPPRPSSAVSQSQHQHIDKLKRNSSFQHLSGVDPTSSTSNSNSNSKPPIPSAPHPAGHSSRSRRSDDNANRTHRTRTPDTRG